MYMTYMGICEYIFFSYFTLQNPCFPKTTEVTSKGYAP